MKTSRILEAALVGIAAGLVLLAPFAKVEESFVLHAVRDLITGVPLQQVSRILVSATVRSRRLTCRQQFDHVEFAGAVPRSFLGPAVLAAVVYPLLWLGHQVGLWQSELAVQMLGEPPCRACSLRVVEPQLMLQWYPVRLVLALLSLATLIFLFRRTRDAFGTAVANLSMMLTLSQFHLVFYLGRTLPNMLAFPLGKDRHISSRCQS